MDIAGILVNLVSGGVGGNVAGAALKDKSLGALGNTIAGAIGGVGGAYILKAVDLLNSMGLADMTAGSIATEAGVTAICGAVVTALVGFVKSKIAK